MIDRVNFKDTKVSRLGLGTMRLPCKTPIKREANPLIDYTKGQELVDVAYKNGVNYFDTAYMYHVGKSEKFIGSALKKYPRDTYYLADKLPIWMCKKPADMEKIFKNQLERTGVDYFDFYLLHSLDGNHFKKCEEYGAYDFLLEKQAQGKIKNIGFSFHGTVDDLKNIVAAHHWDFAQIQMNYLDWKNQDAKTQYQILTDAHIPVIVMEPVRGGKLADPQSNVKDLFSNYDSSKSYASWAIKFVASFDNVVTILSGMNSLKQLDDNIHSLTDFMPLTDNEMNMCFNAAALMNKADVIPCTACDYCSDCPKGVKISSVFSVYNKYKIGELSLDECKKEYSEIDVKADACVNCGSCKNHCPQSIDIPNLLQETIKRFFE